MFIFVDKYTGAAEEISQKRFNNEILGWEECGEKIVKGNITTYVFEEILVMNISK